jgi:hypothetical protein
MVKAEPGEAQVGPKAGAPTRPMAAPEVESKGQTTVELMAAPTVTAEQETASETGPKAAVPMGLVCARSDKMPHVDRFPWRSRGRPMPSALADVQQAADGGAGQ